MTSPLINSAVNNFPCKGWQNDQTIWTTATYTAGETYSMAINNGAATHTGGSCQLSLSYDNGATFKVIKSMIGGCPLQLSYNFTIPSFAPTGTALFAWTWFNKVGNREFYMNCAQVQIEGSSAARRRVRRQSTFDSMDSLPNIWKANIQSLNDCVTREGVDPAFPNPGPDVEYGDRLSSSSPQITGDCDSATPYGSTYRNFGDKSPAASSDPASSDPASSDPASTDLASSDSTPTDSASSDSAWSDTRSSDIPTSDTRSSDAPSSDSPSSDSASCDTTLPSATNSYMAIHRLSTPSAAAATPSSAPFREAGLAAAWASSSDAYPTHLTSDCSGVFPIYVTSTAPTRTVYETSTPSAISSAAPAPPSSLPPYATSPDLSPYLPCQPNSILCTSATTFSICLGSGSSYRPMGSVAAGMFCLPSMSGSYRHDMIVRARPYGDCTAQQEGQIRCINQGAGFLICDHGGWVDMGSVAPGTKCLGDPGYIGYG